MWRRLAASLAMAGALGVNACAEAPGRAELPAEITALEASERIARHGTVLIDVRTPAEWAQTGVAEGAWRVALDDPDFSQKVTDIVNQDPSTEIAFICRSGNRSKTARDRLIAAGYVNSTSVSGGTLTDGGWARSDLPVVNIADIACEKPAGQC
jgi:rhodanese-related sulfurtransferase